MIDMLEVEAEETEFGIVKYKSYIDFIKYDTSELAIVAKDGNADNLDALMGALNG